MTFPLPPGLARLVDLAARAAGTGVSEEIAKVNDTKTDAPRHDDIRSETGWDPTDRAREVSYRLVALASETGTAGEAAFSGHLAELLREIPYFRAHPENVKIVPCRHGTGAASVAALVRGTGRRTLALAGHFDTVTIDNYGELAPLARDPDALRQALIAALGSDATGTGEGTALADLTGGDFVPGRGMLDMKSGLAAGIAILERFAGDEGREGNLLFLATPDEELSSRGMRSIRDALPGLARDWDLDIVGGINLDATSDQGDGAGGRAIYRGSIGKILPFCFVVGQGSHASYPFEGVSAHLISAELISAVETSIELCDRGAGEISPPPICLEGKDLREGYDVTTPDQVWLAFNWLFHATEPEELFGTFAATVREALARATARFAEQAARYAEATGEPRASQPAAGGRVITYEDLRAEVRRTGGADAVDRLDPLAASLASSPNPLEATRRIVAAAVREAVLRGPTVVIGFAGLAYPAVHVSRAPATPGFDAALEHARSAIAAAEGVSIGYREYFTGISDMSFFGAAPIADPCIAANTPAPHLVDAGCADALSFPVVNIGPWGRDMHQRLERLHAPYGFRTLPLLLWDAATGILKAAGERAEPA